MSNVKELVMGINELKLEGTLIDNGWLENLKYPNGKPHLNAIMILSEIIYWYRPTEVKDEVTGVVNGYKKKFKADMLQKSYEGFEKRFGFSRKQVKAAVDFLVEKNLIIREFRTIIIGDKLCNNVMFVEPVLEEIKKITGVNRYIEEEITPLLPLKEGGLLTSKEGGSLLQRKEAVSLEVKTNTKNTTKTSPESSFSSSSSSSTPENVINELITLFESDILGGKKLGTSTKPKFINWCNKLDIGFIKAVIEYGAETNGKSYAWFETTVTRKINNGITTKEQFINDIMSYRKNRSEKYSKKSKGSKADPKDKPLKTANFTQRDYDYDSLEKQLLGWDKE